MTQEASSPDPLLIVWHSVTSWWKKFKREWSRTLSVSSGYTASHWWLGSGGKEAELKQTWEINWLRVKSLAAVMTRLVQQKTHLISHILLLGGSPWTSIRRQRLYSLALGRECVSIQMCEHWLRQETRFISQLFLITTYLSKDHLHILLQIHNNASATNQHTAHYGDIMRRSITFNALIYNTSGVRVCQVVFMLIGYLKNVYSNPLIPDP